MAATVVAAGMTMEPAGAGGGGGTDLTGVGAETT